MYNSRTTAGFERFTQTLVRSGLLAKQELDERVLPLLVDQLIAEGLLTRWQCDKLLDGKHKGFFLDGYKLVGHLETDDEYSYYRVVEVATGRQYAMRVTPQGRRKDPSEDSSKIEYLIVRELT